MTLPNKKDALMKFWTRKLVWLMLLLSYLVYAGPNVQAQVTSNVLLRTFLIQVGNSTGTAFSIEVDGRQYLISAKHVFAGVADGTKCNINLMQKNKTWSPLNVLVLKVADPVDIVVLVPPQQITVTFELTPESKGITLGQDMFFVGFPFGQFESVDVSPMPMGYVAKAALAQIQRVGAVHEQLLWLDGTNNPGYSGSPVIFHDITQPGLTFKVAGVISGFKNFPLQVQRLIPIKAADINPQDERDGKIARKESAVYKVEPVEDEFVLTNSGMAQAWAIDSAVDLIKKNPRGPLVKP